MVKWGMDTREMTPLDAAVKATVRIKNPVRTRHRFFHYGKGPHSYQSPCPEGGCQEIEAALNPSRTICTNSGRRKKGLPSGLNSSRPPAGKWKTFSRRIPQISLAGDREEARAWYASRSKQIDAMADQLHRQQRKVEASRAKFDAYQADFDSKVRSLRLASSFVVMLADGTEEYAYPIAESRSYDLALLKIDGYRTPALLPAQAGTASQGDPVYAIGHPAGLRNTVAKGIVSGFEGFYVKTDASIYPGNSGGPLVDRWGRVARGQHPETTDAEI